MKKMTEEQKTRSQKADAIKKTIKKLFNADRVETCLYSNTDIELTVYEGNVNFDTLLSVSEMFGTKDINMRGGETGGGCETCDYGNDKYVVITVKKATKGL